MNILLTLLSAFLDRLSGDKRGPGSLLEAFGVGLSLWFLSGMGCSFYALLFGAAWALGSASGWSFVGDILNRRKPKPSYKGEWWQNAYLVERLWLSAWVRGLMWAIPLLPFAYYLDASLIAPAIGVIIAFPYSLWLAREYTVFGEFKINNTVIAVTPWQKSQLIRGGLVAVLTLGIGALL